MKLQNLRFFCAAYRHKGIRKAAEELNLSYTAIAYGINELESEFQVALFEKKGRNVVPTREGDRFFYLCSDLLERANAAEKTMHEVARQNDRIHLGISPMLSEMVFRDVKTEFNKRYPDIMLQRYELGSVAMKERILTGQLDCGICIHTGDDDPAFEKQQIGETEYVCCVGKDHPLAESLFVSVTQIKDEPMVVLDNSFDSGRFARRVFDREGLRPNIVLETGQLDTVKRMVTSGEAISILYKDYVKLYPNQMVCVPIDGLRGKQQIQFIWPANRNLTSNMIKLISCMSSKQAKGGASNNA